MQDASDEASAMTLLAKESQVLVQLTKSLQRVKSLYEQTYEALRDSILSGQLAPGDRLVETQLAEQLQVSRTPIREAIRQLQREELICADANGWLRVATVSATEAIHLYDCRMALETMAVAEACRHITPQQLAQLEQAIDHAEALHHAGVQADSGQLLELDYQFHYQIAASSGNGCLLSLLDQVFSKMALLRIQTTQHNPRVLEIRAEHQNIYRAIAQRDADRATQMIQDHLIASKARVVQELESLQS
jgi:DNA-binding GntR family transcriptional regulator